MTNLLMIGHLLSKKTTKQKTFKKWSVWIKAWLKNFLYTSEFNNIFAELMMSDKEKFKIQYCFVSSKLCYKKMYIEFNEKNT